MPYKVAVEYWTKDKEYIGTNFTEVIAEELAHKPATRDI